MLDTIRIGTGNVGDFLVKKGNNRKKARAD